mmetsp:Transcript_2044/g.5180  ORF Transcript_2044/g.5180 Transcript_2044/m.5180 type:complete len:645 (-) Transcript_2044:118-2052(-)
MKPYETGTWGIGFVFSISGSVFPKGAAWAVPDALLAVAISVCYRFIDDSLLPEWLDLKIEDVDRCVSLMGGYYGVMGFILVFRSQLAYSRWWEGGALLQQLRGEWFNAYSSLLAFCSTAECDRSNVDAFQQLLMRLMSLLYCSALEQVADLQDKHFEIFDIDGLEADSLRFLNQANDKCEVTLQWIQRLIVEASGSGVIPVPAPILSRVFQEFGRGIVNLNHVRKIAEFPFPFPWPQMITFMLIGEWLMTPVLCGTAISSPVWAGIVTFFVTFAFWNIHYIAQELENPFGDDANDLPLREMQVDMNRSLRQLLDRKAQIPPVFHFVHKSDHATVTSKVLEELGRGAGFHDENLEFISGRSTASKTKWKRRYASPQHTRQSVQYHIARRPAGELLHRRSSTQPDLSKMAELVGNIEAFGEMQITASAPVIAPSWRRVPEEVDSNEHPPGRSRIGLFNSRSVLGRSLSQGMRGMTSILSRKGSMQSAHQQVTLPYGAAQPASPIESSSSPPSPVFGSTSDTRSLKIMRTQDGSEGSNNSDSSADVEQEQEQCRAASIESLREALAVPDSPPPGIFTAPPSSPASPTHFDSTDSSVRKQRRSSLVSSPGFPSSLQRNGRRVSFFSHTFSALNIPQPPAEEPDPPRWA